MHPSKKKVGIFLLFVIAIAIFVVLILSRVFNFNIAKKTTELIPNDDEKLVFGFRNEQLTPDSSFSKIRLSFESLLSEYIANGKYETRESLRQIRQLAASRYPKEFEEKQFIIPCLDDSCSMSDLPQGVGEIIKRIEGLSFDEPIKRATINSIKTSLAYDDDTKEAVNYYSAAFSGFKALYESAPSQSEKENVDSISQLFLRQYSQRFPKDYASLEEVGYFNLTNEE